MADLFTNDDDLFRIPPTFTVTRYLLTGGRTLDVRSPYQGGSDDRGMVLEEARRRWGGTKEDWKIEGSAKLGEWAMVADHE